jgi:hypothetical protein
LDLLLGIKQLERFDALIRAEVHDFAERPAQRAAEDAEEAHVDDGVVKQREALRFGAAALTCTVS